MVHSRPAVSALFLDIDNTLLDFDACVKKTMQDGFAFYGLRPYEEWMYPVFEQINGGLWQALEKGEITYAQLFQRRWQCIFDALDISFDGSVFEAYFRKSLHESAIPVDGALETLQCLYGRVPLYAASNGPYLQQLHRLEKAGFLPYFSDLFISEEIGFSKPEPSFFRTAIDRIGAIPPGQIMMVGDSLTSDMDGAIASGLISCFFDRKRTGAGERHINYILHSLQELPLLLGES